MTISAKSGNFKADKLNDTTSYADDLFALSDNPCGLEKQVFYNFNFAASKFILLINLVTKKRVESWWYGSDSH